MKPVFDTNVFIEYAEQLSMTTIARSALSVVVLYELAATTSDQSTFKKYQAFLHVYQHNNGILTPTETDWWECAKVIRRLRYQQKSAAHGKTPKLQHAHQLQNDALIARTAYLNQCIVVTVDIDDYQQLSRYMKVNVISAEEYFGF
ncbi:MAG: type II toxin-antitoxin system VapC family toxin [Acidobacteria bacterium]|nr:type II toxin-antitoxin system VapC family toxin [Acidobacteriota bacterium]